MTTRDQDERFERALVYVSEHPFQITDDMKEVNRSTTHVSIGGHVYRIDDLPWEFWLRFFGITKFLE